jgi:hypothetical protein
VHELMPKSTNIYLVMSVNTFYPVAAFTVKSELRSWLMSKPDNILRNLVLFKMPDNPHRNSGGTTELDIAEIIRDGQPPEKPEPAP